MRSPELEGFGEGVRSLAARAAIAELRQTGADAGEAPALALAHARRLADPGPGPVINLSGVILHTGLGRARLAPSAAEAVAAAARGHSLVEFDIESGRRGDRQEHVRDLLRTLTGAEDAHVVNNCAGAVLLTLSALCAGREVVLSRGQMVEIGGSFRMPEIVGQSGCRLVEVGCTNKTRLSDYEASLTEDTAAILRCHPSNFQIVGFTASPSVADLAELAHRAGIWLIDDAGSGCLVDTRRFGLPREATVQDAIAAGADLVLFSGDKLLGGPQAGLIVGRGAAIERLRSHPLARALRIDKLDLAGLRATLQLYVDGRESEIPVWAAIGREPADVRREARRLARDCALPSEVVASVTEVGGGSLPGARVPTWALAIRTSQPESVLDALRRCSPPIIGRIEEGRVLLDPRTLSTEESALVRRSLRGLSGAPDASLRMPSPASEPSRSPRR